MSNISILDKGIPKLHYLQMNSHLIVFHNILKYDNYYKYLQYNISEYKATFGNNIR